MKSIFDIVSEIKITNLHNKPPNIKNGYEIKFNPPVITTTIPDINASTHRGTTKILVNVDASEISSK